MDQEVRNCLRLRHSTGVLKLTLCFTWMQGETDEESQLTGLVSALDAEKEFLLHDRAQAASLHAAIGDLVNEINEVNNLLSCLQYWLIRPRHIHVCITASLKSSAFSHRLSLATAHRPPTFSPQRSRPCSSNSRSYARGAMLPCTGIVRGPPAPAP